MGRSAAAASITRRPYPVQAQSTGKPFSSAKGKSGTRNKHLREGWGGRQPVAVHSLPFTTISSGSSSNSSGA